MDGDFYGARLVGAGLGYKKGAGDERNERQKPYYMLVAKEYPDHTFGRKRTVSGLDSNASSS